MPEFKMPEGLYLSISGRIHPGSGGQTRALLMRNRLLVQHTDARPILLALDDAPIYPESRRILREQGLLVDGMRLLNIFEWYRETDIDDLAPVLDELPSVNGLEPEDVPHPDGTVYQTRYLKQHNGQLVMIDYRRPDGSVYLRVPAGGPGAVSPATKCYLVNREGRPVGQWATQRGWRKAWVISLLEPEQRAFLICDSRFAIADILPLRDERLHILHLVHNVHVQAPYRWNSPLTPTYVHLLDNVRHLDALVTLTSRQSQDLADRLGATDNLFVVPNPVEKPPMPDPLPARDRRRFAMVARLEYQKRIEDAIRAFALVLKEEPEATLDIYGDGRLRDFLADEIAALGVQDSVFLRGHDPQARQTLWTATGMLMTSRFEGYPLATLESLSQGCPVITYNMKYGPQEQITQGVDGFLVEQGELQTMADHLVRMIRDPELVTRMSQAALAKAEEHDHRALIRDWRTVIEQVIERRSRRTVLKTVELDVTRLGYRHPHRLPDDLTKNRLLKPLAGRRSASAGFTKAPTVEFAGRLKVTGTSPEASWDDVEITLDAVGDESGAIVPIPLTARRSGKQFRLTASFDPAEIFDAAGFDATAMRLRLRLVWHNSSWQTTLNRPRRLAPNYELAYTGSGELALLRGPNAPGIKEMAQS